MAILILSRILTYLSFRTLSKPLSGHGIHSPFVYFLTTEVLAKANKNKAALKPVELTRKQLLHNNSFVNPPFWGASTNFGSKPLKVKQVARKAGSSATKLQALFALAKFQQPDFIIELGTSLGLSAMAFGLACPNSKIVTIEGNEHLAQFANRNLAEAGINNVEILNANFDSALPIVIKNISAPFMAYIDGNHSFEPTLKYYNMFAEIASPECLIIIDDLYWSTEMQQAWQIIVADTRNSICIDLYSMGLVYFREGVVKQNFAIGNGLY